MTVRVGSVRQLATYLFCASRPQSLICRSYCSASSSVNFTSCCSAAILASRAGLSFHVETPPISLLRNHYITVNRVHVRTYAMESEELPDDEVWLPEQQSGATTEATFSLGDQYELMETIEK